MRSNSRLLALLVVALPAALAACSPPPPPPAAPPVKPAAPVANKPAPPPPLTAKQKLDLDECFAKARLVAAQARADYEAGRQISKQQGQEAANDIWVKAKKKYQEAIASTEPWIEPDLGKLTKPQIDLYLKSYMDERGAWIRAISEMGKLHAK